MIILDATTRSLEAKLSGAITTNQLPIVVTYVDITTTTYVPGATATASNNTTAVTIAAAPGASTQRHVKFISIQNQDTVSATVIVQYNDNTTIRQMLKATLAVNDTLMYNDGEGFRVIDSNGQTKTALSGAPLEAEYIVGAAHATLTAERVATDSTSITWDLSVAGQAAVKRAALTGDVTASANANTTTIAADAVTYAKMQNVSATDKVLGRSTAGAGDVEEIACTAAGRALIDDADAAAQRTTLGLGTLATQSGTFSGTSSGTNTGDQTITLTGDVTGTGTGSFAASMTTNHKYRTITYIIDGGGVAITTGVKGDLEIPFACTINRATLLADQSGSIVIDIWKDTYANYPPTVADTITASAKPTLSSAAKSQDATLTGWTTSIAAGDTLRFNVDSITTCTRVTLSLRVTMSA